MNPDKRPILLVILSLLMLAGGYLYFENQKADWFEDRIGGLADTPLTELHTDHRNVKVIAHYMPWFERRVNSEGKTEWQHWQWQGEGEKHDPDSVLENGQHDIATAHYPLIGPYHSLDTAVIEYHILTARLIGVEAFMCNWYGPGTYTDRAVAQMIPIAERLDFKIGICLEEKALFPPYSSAANREDLIHELTRHLNHIVESYGDSVAFLKHQSDSHAVGVELPLLFMFNFYGEGDLGSNLLTAAEIQTAREEVDQPVFLIRNDLNKSMFPGSDGVYIWCAPKPIRDELYKKADGILESSPSLVYRSAVASPGFDDSGVNGWGNGARQTARRGTDEFLDNWTEAKLSGFDSIQIVTWNDFQEGTNIEPAVEYGFDFVDMAEAQVEAITGRSSILSDNDLGFEIYNLRVAIRELDDQQKRKDFDGKVDLVVEALVKATESADSPRSQIQKLKRQIENE